MLLHLRSTGILGSTGISAKLETLYSRVATGFLGNVHDKISKIFDFAAYLSVERSVAITKSGGASGSDATVWPISTLRETIVPSSGATISV
jgi:hypothetical protein